jgi:uncharacterized protein (TIGR03086 family)
MSSASSRYARLADRFTQTLAGIGPAQWDAPTPCEDWAVRDVVTHVVESEGRVLGFVGQSSPPDLPDVASDPAGAWAAVRDTVQAGLDDAETAGKTFEGLSGPTTFEDTVDRFLCADLVIHRWDIARATGQDATIDPQDIADVRATIEGLGDAVRSPGAFGPELTPPDGADEQTALLAFLGRRAW